MIDHRDAHSTDYECINHGAADWCCPSCCPKAGTICGVCGEEDGLGNLVPNLAGGLTHAGCLAPIDCGHPCEDLTADGKCPSCSQGGSKSS